ncbi:hypothetical protein K1T71_003809 [Dendrolimus kikuchii]|uniref:Uncharacterized protein n=1 Tax=Dendrolimus kikuchii TaxID=765133 RepID=A0ACC1D967_9NEOP|nr:hypothetical protein K1T71_003809 [Dendrolimus kikuchii]
MNRCGGGWGGRGGAASAGGRCVEGCAAARQSCAVVVRPPPGPPRAAGARSHGEPEPGCGPKPRGSAQRPGVRLWTRRPRSSRRFSRLIIYVYLAGRCSSEDSAGRLVQVRSSVLRRGPPTLRPEVHPMHPPRKVNRSVVTEERLYTILN